MRSEVSRNVGILTCLTLIFLLVLLARPAMAGHEKGTPKTGILLVAFGTSVPEAQGAFRNIEKMVTAAFPGVPVRWAYTSKIIRNKLAKQGKVLDSPAVALARMNDEGFNRVAVQSLHTIPGEEYHDMVRTVQAFQGMPEGNMKLSIGMPLLARDEDLRRVTSAVLAMLPPERKKDEAVVLMGHGTPHPANVYYPGMQYYLWKKDPNVFLGTVEGSPSLDDVQEQLKAKGAKKVWLVPFMSVAGDHARNDLAGPEDDSWMSILTKAGYKCQAVLKGTAEYDPIAEVWGDHLKTALAGLK
ncbi:MAG: sirohydrochlorin cobaltochelatase [Proteobacteria bacterium]|nr:sirohydrochlorin cobaltochelatase [Pseudomonadota bacterium]